MINKNISYIVLDYHQHNIVNWSDVTQTSLHNVRFNKEKTKFILKFYGDCPTWAEGLRIYSKDTLLNYVLNNDSW